MLYRNFLSKTSSLKYLTHFFLQELCCVVSSCQGFFYFKRTYRLLRHAVYFLHTFCRSYNIVDTCVLQNTVAGVYTRTGFIRYFIYDTKEKTFAYIHRKRTCVWQCSCIERASTYLTKIQSYKDYHIWMQSLNLLGI